MEDTLENRGFRPTTIRVYSANLRRYLKFAGTDRPSEKDLKAFQERLFDRQKRSYQLRVSPRDAEYFSRIAASSFI
jgi:hypothetical protein